MKYGLCEKRKFEGRVIDIKLEMKKHEQNFQAFFFLNERRQRCHVSCLKMKKKCFP